jgi:hypothetical protein
MDEFEPDRHPHRLLLGRQPDGTGPWKYFATHTPGAANTTTGYSTPSCRARVIPSPADSTPPTSTWHSPPSQTGAVVRYTLDGSEPTEASPVFTNAFDLGSKAGTPNDLSDIPTNYESSGPPYYEDWQPPDGEVFKFHVVRARTFPRRRHPQPSRGPVVSRRCRRHQPLHPPRHLDRDRRRQPVRRRYRHLHPRERQHVAIRQRLGTAGHHRILRTRRHAGLRRPYRRPPARQHHPQPPAQGPAHLRPRRRTLRIPDFPDKAVAEFDTFILRNGGNDWGNGVIRDLYLQSLAENTGLDRQYGRPVLVFLNGEYWGLHDLRERFDDDYACTITASTKLEYVQVEIDYAVRLALRSRLRQRQLRLSAAISLSVGVRADQRPLADPRRLRRRPGPPRRRQLHRFLPGQYFLRQHRLARQQCPRLALRRNQPPKAPPPATTAAGATCSTTPISASD